MVFGEFLIFLSNNWVWVIRIFSFIFVAALLFLITNKSNLFPIKKKKWKYHLFFSFTFVLFYTILYVLISTVVLTLNPPIGADKIKAAGDVEEIPSNMLEQYANDLTKSDLFIILPLTILAAFIVLSFFVRRYYELDLKDSLKLALVLVIFQQVILILLAIPSGMLFRHLQTHPVFQYLY